MSKICNSINNLRKNFREFFIHKNKYHLDISVKTQTKKKIEGINQYSW